jgi:isoquinoline 1-oxidoreductase alpha subunit
MPTYTLRINQESIATQAPPEMPLLWFLRDELGLCGTKFGCGKGLCGACTVHVDGQAARSCQLPLSSLADREITTIEGLAGDRDSLHPLQETWIERDVPQCGYCQPGQIMQAAALLAKDAKPSRETIVATMSGNICRCGTYTRIVAAIEATAAKGLVFKVIGQSPRPTPSSEVHHDTK